MHPAGLRVSLQWLFLLSACSSQQQQEPAVQESADTTDTGCAQPATWYPDADGDGHGVPGDTALACERPSGYASTDDDCDDGDPYVNPGWDEDPEDGKDNDCDGRLDEEWSGVTVAFYDEDGAGSVLEIDSVGRLAAQVQIVDTQVFPLWLDHGLGAPWVINNSYTTLELLDEAGYSTVLAEFTEDDTDWFLAGICTHPDGYYLASTLDKLWRVDEDGTRRQVASWNADFSDSEHFDLIPYTLAADPADGQVGLFGYYGGFATWNESSGLRIHRRPDLENWDGVVTYAGACRDGGGWYSIKSDSGTAALSIASFDFGTGQWSDRVSWEEQWTPNVLTIDGDSGDYYVTAAGGQYPSVWRVLEDGSYASDFYMVEEPIPNAGFWGVVSNY